MRFFSLPRVLSSSSRIALKSAACFHIYVLVNWKSFHSQNCPRAIFFTHLHALHSSLHIYPCILFIYIILHLRQRAHNRKVKGFDWPRCCIRCGDSAATTIFLIYHSDFNGPVIKSREPARHCCCVVFHFTYIVAYTHSRELYSSRIPTDNCTRASAEKRKKSSIAYRRRRGRSFVGTSRRFSFPDRRRRVQLGFRVRPRGTYTRI